MQLNCMIVEDEPVARKGLEEYVKEVAFLNLVGQAENAIKAAGLMSERPVDLMFLDIQMPKLTGIEFLKTMKNPPLIIFTTAYSEYALEGYALDVVDYLMKPITFERFLKAAQKAYDLHQLKKASSLHEKVSEDHFFVKCDGKFEKVFFNEVTYIEGLQNYAIIHTVNRKLITYITMTSVEQQLPKDQFLKVHKSFIVSIQQVKAIEGNEILIGQARIPISRTLKDEVVNQILGNKLFKR
jgi:DNA-binding LytR/AlgR family response regulator